MVAQDSITAARQPRRGLSWSPNREFWAELRVVAQGLRWRRVNMNLNRVDGVPKDDTGVYLICVGPPQAFLRPLCPYTVIYAGQVKSRSRGLRTRFREHIQHPRPRLRLYMSCYQPEVDFWYAMTSDAARIDALEILLIDLFNPPCNNISAPGAATLRGCLGVATPIGANADDTHD